MRAPRALAYVMVEVLVPLAALAAPPRSRSPSAAHDAYDTDPRRSP